MSPRLNDRTEQPAPREDAVIHILVVEDSDDHADLLRMFLEDQGFRVRRAADGVEAIEMVHEEQPDLILLDFMMPRMDGVEVCRRLKSGFETMNTPIIMISGQEDPNAIVEAFESGADDYVVKPFDFPTLLARIRANLRRTIREISTNPLTRIPGINFLHRRFKDLLKEVPEAALAIADIDNFKAFNDRYGFEVGDRVICALAEILRRYLEPLGPENAILVHVGGDDFIFVCARKRVDKLCQGIIRDFDEQVPGFYNEEDRRRGYIQATNRRGHTEIFPLMTLSIGVAARIEGMPCSVTALAESANEVKNYLKKQTLSTYMVNRRRRR